MASKFHFKTKKPHKPFIKEFKLPINMPTNMHDQQCNTMERVNTDRVHYQQTPGVRREAT